MAAQRQSQRVGRGLARCAPRRWQSDPQPQPRRRAARSYQPRAARASGAQAAPQRHVLAARRGPRISRLLHLARAAAAGKRRHACGCSARGATAAGPAAPRHRHRRILTRDCPSSPRRPACGSWRLCCSAVVSVDAPRRLRPGRVPVRSAARSLFHPSPTRPLPAPPSQRWQLRRS